MQALLAALVRWSEDTCITFGHRWWVSILELEHQQGGHQVCWTGALATPNQVCNLQWQCQNRIRIQQLQLQCQNRIRSATCSGIAKTGSGVSRCNCSARIGSGLQPTVAVPKQDQESAFALAVPEQDQGSADAVPEQDPQSRASGSVLRAGQQHNIGFVYMLPDLVPLIHLLLSLFL